MKRLALILPVLAVTVACGSGMNLSGTKLNVRAIDPSEGLAVFRLDCGPTGGDVTDPSAACSALAHDPKLVTSPQQPIVCGGPDSDFDVTISGRLAGKHVRQTVSTCWTPGMPTLDKLGLLTSLHRNLRPRRRGLVLAHRTHTFPAGALRPGDLIVCTILRHRLALPIPEHGEPIRGTGVEFGGKLVEVGDSPDETTIDAVDVTLKGKRNPDGSITASCFRGKV
jgi:hypothetical protein